MMTKKKVVKKPVKRVKKALTLRQVLTVVEDALLQNKTRKEVWDVLTALRGPDDSNYTLKNHLTIPIRRAAFPRLAAACDDMNSNIYCPADFESGPYNADAESEDHFSAHARNAAYALDIRE